MSTLQRITPIAQNLAIDWSSNGKRARKIVRRSNMAVTEKYPSFRNDASIHCESFIERDCFIRLDVDPNIVSFKEQPAKLTYQFDGKTYTHFPDIFVVGKRGATFIEVKSNTDPYLAEAIERGNALRQPLLVQGVKYMVVTDLEIRQEPYFSNAKLLLKLGRNPVSAVRREQLRCLLKVDGPRWSDISAGIYGKTTIFEISRLILEGQFSYDESYALSEASIISAEPSVASAKGSFSWL